MSTDALLTLAAAVIAVLTLLSPEKRDDLWLRVTPFSLLTIVTGFIVLIGIKLSPVWVASGMPVLFYWRWGFDPEIASFTTISVVTAIVVARVMTVRLHPSRVLKKGTRA